MTLRVTFTSKARLELHEVALWWAENRDPEQAARWLESLEALIGTLAENPLRYATAREDKAFPFTLREFHFGLGRRATHRVLYRVRDDDHVIVYGIRHVAQQDIGPEDIK